MKKILFIFLVTFVSFIDAEDYLIEKASIKGGTSVYVHCIQNYVFFITHPSNAIVQVMRLTAFKGQLITVPMKCDEYKKTTGKN